MRGDGLVRRCRIEFVPIEIVTIEAVRSDARQWRNRSLNDRAADLTSRCSRRRADLLSLSFPTPSYSPDNCLVAPGHFLPLLFIPI